MTKSGLDERLARHDVICFSSVDWGFIWQGQHEIMSRFAAAGSRVLFVENTSVRAPRLSDLGRIAARARRWLDGAVRAPTDVPAGLTVYSPIVAPYPWSWWSRLVNRYLFVRPVRRLAAGLRDPLVWVFLPTPTVRDAVSACRSAGGALVYYCVADFAEVADDVEALRRSETELVREADVVLVNGGELRERFRTLRRDVGIYPFGVDLRAFGGAPRPEPADLARIARPRAGYIGGLHRHLEVDWLDHAAEAMPDVSFVLVGPIQTDLGSLRSRPNVHLLGQKPHDELPAYVAGFDASLVPYAVTPFTASVVPTKLFEYLALGGPVITTALPELSRLQIPDGVVAIADGPESFAQHIREAVARPPTPEERTRRREFAERVSWEGMLAEMMTAVESAIARRA